MTQSDSDITFGNAVERLRAYIDEHGMRRTREREVILEKVCGLRCFSVEQLSNALTELTISRATVYNALRVFEQAGIFHRLDKEFGVRAGQYEVVQANASHIQIICQRCGRISEVRDTTINRMLADKRFTNFNPQRFSLYIYGTCKVCRRKPIIADKSSGMQQRV